MKNNIGSTIREIRKSKGITTLKLSEVTGISRGYISQIERNLKNPSLDIAFKIADALEVGVDYLRFKSMSNNVS